MGVMYLSGSMAPFYRWDLNVESSRLNLLFQKIVAENVEKCM